NVRVIEGRLERLVLDEQALPALQIRMEDGEILFEPPLTLSNVRGSGVVRTVGEPEDDVAAAQAPRDGDAVARVLQGARAHALVRVAERSEFVGLILEQIRIDRSRLDLTACRQRRDAIDVADAARKVPEHVERERRARAGELVDLPGV